MQKVTITVEGKAGTGKSTLANQIASHLEHIGLNVTLANSDRGTRCATEHLKTIATMREETEIDIVEKQASRTE